MKKIYVFAIALIMCIASFVVGRMSKTSDYPVGHAEEVVNRIDEVKEVSDIAPATRDSIVVKYQYVSVPLTLPPEDSIIGRSIVSDIAVVVSGDTAQLQIPISQKVYESEDYRAYISGYHAQMDSIFIKQRTTTIKLREPYQMPRFSVGVHAGYGMTPKGFQPYVGIGVSLNLFNL